MQVEEMVAFEVTPDAGRLYRLEAALRELSGGQPAAIPCMGCSLRGGRPPPRPRDLRLPRAALAHHTPSDDGTRNQGQYSGWGRDPIRGRGRAATLRDRARRVRERHALPHSRSTPLGEDDSLSSVGSSQRSFILGDGTGESEDELASLRSSSPAVSQQYTQDSGVGPSLTRPTEGQPPDMTLKCDPSPEYQPWTSHTTSSSSLTQPEQNKQTNAPLQPGRTKRKKFVPVDMREAYEENQSELLVGIPAGAENSNVFSSGFNSNYSSRSSGFTLGSEDVFTAEYRPQKQPKVNSILDFPGLPQDRVNKEINFMNTTPKKLESMKSIASFIADEKKEVGVCRPGKRDEEGAPSEGDMEGCVVVFDHVPSAISKKDLTDLIQPYGEVGRVSVFPTGHTYSAHVSMAEPGQAQWVVDILDGSEALLPAGEDGQPLSVRLLTPTAR